MAKISVGRGLQALGVVAFCLLAFLVALNSTTIMPLIWHFWYGSHTNWNGIEVEINYSEFFAPITDGNPDLFIGDWESRNANIVVHQGRRTPDHQRAFVADYCGQTECRESKEVTADINGRRVTSFSFLKSNGRSNSSIFHEYLVIDGADVWVEYFGVESSYSKHKQTLDSIVSALTVKHD